MNGDMLSPQPLSIDPLRRDRITAISSAVERRPIVLVLGMHRSGTSLCSHILSALGLDMADTIPGPGATSSRPAASSSPGKGRSAMAATSSIQGVACSAPEATARGRLSAAFGGAPALDERP